MFRDALASPFESCAMRRVNSGESEIDSFCEAFVIIFFNSYSVSALRTKTLERDSKAEMTSNDGFSVVAPISVSVPSST